MSETHSHFVAVCPNCLATLKVNYSYSGNHVRCKHCDHKFRALAPDDLTSTPTSAEYPADLRTPIRAAADRIMVICPGCATSLSVRRELAGQHVRCKRCDHKFLVEKIEEVPSSPPTASDEADLFDHLYASYGQAVDSAASSQTPSRSSELESQTAAISADRDRLQTELTSLQEQYSRLQSEHSQTEHHIEQLRGELGQLQSERRDDQAERERLGSELASIQLALGDLPPSAIGALRDERDDLLTQIDLLRSQPQVPASDASPPPILSEGDHRRDEEPRETQRQVEELTQRVRDLDGALNNVRAERTELDRQFRQLQEDLAQARAREEDFASRLRQQGDELACKENEITRLMAGRTETEDHGKLLQTALTDHEGEVASLRDQLTAADSERANLQAQVGELLDLRETLNMERQLAAGRIQELSAAQNQIEALTRQVENLDGALNDSRADRAELNRRVGQLEDDLAEARSQREELTGRLREHHDELCAKGTEITGLLAGRAESEDHAKQLQATLTEQEGELSSLREQLAAANSERDKLQSQVSDLLAAQEILMSDQQLAAEQERELSEARHQLEQLAHQVPNLEAGLERSRAECAELAQQVRQLEDELVGARAQHEEASSRLGAHADELTAKGDEIMRLLALQKEAEDQLKQLQAGLATREEELTQVREQLASANSQHAELKGQLRDVLDAQQKANAEYLDGIESHRARLTAQFESAIDAERSRHADQLAQVEARAGENAQLVDRLRSEILSLTESRSSPDSDLEAARQEIADLRRRLNEKESSQKSMSSLLEGMGIRLH